MKLPFSAMILSKEEAKHVYRRTARFYDLALWVYRLFGTGRHRRQAVHALHLQPGDTVVDMGCGTGLNFRLLQKAVGPEGRIVGVDLTDAMLDRARHRIQKAGWQNIELVEADLATYTFPPGMNAALATFALEMVPEYDAVIRRVAETLPLCGRLAVYGLKHPERWPDWLIRLGIWLNKPFGVSRDYAALRPWESVRRHMKEVRHKEFFFGAAYLSVGEASGISPGNSDE
jgi:demethylmenaquinone methyltransferase/2-methoxy-6-polyprenyl-1,4-benzoquinol methylase